MEWDTTKAQLLAETQEAIDKMEETVKGPQSLTTVCGIH